MALAAVVARPSDEDTDDQQLVARVRAGDDRAFELLYVRYQRAIAAYVRGLVDDHGRAEDITQEVFMSALRRMRETEREIAFRPWVYEIAKNACIDAFRRSRNRKEISFDAREGLGAGDHDRLAGMGATPDMAIDAKLDLDNLCRAFGGLSELHHQILVMRELDGLSYREIGERMVMSRPAVESTLFRARRRLGEEYEELVSGRRCMRVRAIVDCGADAAGIRDRRRMSRHLSHCQPCRRYARLAGVDLEPRPALAPAAARIAALLPLPALGRRRTGSDAATQLLGIRGRAAVAQWSANVGGLDPGALVGWSKAVRAAATVAVAGIGAGAAMTEHHALKGFVARAPVLSGVMGSSAAPREQPGAPAHERPSAQRWSGGAAAGRASASGQTTEPAAGHGAPAGGAVLHTSRPASAGGGQAPVGGGAGAGAGPLKPVHEQLDGALGIALSNAHGVASPRTRVSGAAVTQVVGVTTIQGSGTLAAANGAAAAGASATAQQASGLIGRVIPAGG